MRLSTIYFHVQRDRIFAEKIWVAAPETRLDEEFQFAAAMGGLGGVLDEIVAEERLVETEMKELANWEFCMCCSAERRFHIRSPVDLCRPRRRAHQNPCHGIPLPPATARKWTVESWKTKKAFQLSEYPNVDDLRDVLKTIEEFPPLVLAGEARSPEDNLGEADVGKAFLLQVDPIVASFSGGAVGVISALILIEVEANNVEHQEKKRCRVVCRISMLSLLLLLGAG
ncbi:Phospho-2-dehydro-3-deoxyheptonate aldolase 1, chloroplastic [Linum grandiflorum]